MNPSVDLLAMTIDELDAFFKSYGVSTDTPGFYDHPALAELESQGVEILTAYGRFVSLRNYTDAYLNSVRPQILAGAEKLNQLLLADGRLGACIDCSMSFSRMLDEVGIWNYTVKGALSITFPDSSEFHPFHFWPIDEQDGSGREYGHKWVAAPPFQVVDLTLKLQEYPKPFARLLPDRVLLEDAESVEPDYNDVFSPAVLNFAQREGIV